MTIWCARACLGVVIVSSVSVTLAYHCGRLSSGFDGKKESDWQMWSDTLNEVSYAFVVPKEMSTESLHAKLLWKEGESPRCTPKKAIERAIGWINGNLPVKDDEKSAWRCRQLRLRPKGEDEWYWIVDAQFLPRVGGTTGIHPEFSVLVFADATIPIVRADAVAEVDRMDGLK